MVRVYEVRRLDDGRLLGTVRASSPAGASVLALAVLGEAFGPFKVEPQPERDQDAEPGADGCEFCGRAWSPDHECYGTRGEAADAARLEDDHR